MKIAYYISAFFALLMASTAQALPGPESASFDKGAMFTVAGYKGSSPLSGFPVLVRIANNSPSGFAYSQLHSSSDGADIAFVNMEGNGLPFEIDTWDPNGTSLIWVRLPSMTNGTQFVMCWGSAASGKTVCNESPFSGYVGVWHMSEASGTVADSSGNELTATPAGKEAATVSVADSGWVGSGRQCITDGYLSIADANALDVGSSLAVSGWFNMSSSQPASGDVRFFSRKIRSQATNDGWEVIRKSGNIAARGSTGENIAAYTPSPSFAGTGWKHVFVVYTNNTATIFENGIQKVPATAGAAPVDNDNSFSIGSYSGGGSSYFVGNVDECRLLGAVPSASADWVKAEYDSMIDAAFLTAGVATSYKATSAPEIGLSVSDVQYTNASFVVSVGSLGMDVGKTTNADWVDLLVVVSQNSDLSSPIPSVPLSHVMSAPASLSVEIAPLALTTTYYAQLRATNSFGVTGESGVVSFTTLEPGPVFSASVSTEHLAPDISLSFANQGFGSAVSRIEVQVSTASDFSHIDLSKTCTVDLSAMPTNVNDIVLTRLPIASSLYYRFTAVNSDGYDTTIYAVADLSIGDGDNVWSGLSENIDDADAYIFAGGLPASTNTLYFTKPAGLSPVINRDVAMPMLRFTSGQAETVDTAYHSGYHSCGYNLSGSGVLSFTAEKPILQASCGTNVISNPILFSRSDEQSVTIASVGEDNAWLNLNGRLMLPDGVSNTTMKVTGRGNTVLGGASPDFMGELSVASARLTFASPFAMTNVSKFYFDGDPTSMSNAIGAPLVFPRTSSLRMEIVNWSGRKLHLFGAPFVFPRATFEWGIRDYEHSMFEADCVVSNVVVRKHGHNGDACLGKKGAGVFIVEGKTTWHDPAVKSYIELFSGCFCPMFAAGLPPSGEFYIPNDHAWRSTLGLSGDFSPMLDGSSTPRFFQTSKWACWGFTGFGGERTVCWNADPTLNLTNTTSGSVEIPLGDAAHTNVANKAYSDYYAYPPYFMFGNRSEFADGTILFMNPIRYELGQDWDATTRFESTNHIVAARLRGSLKLGNSGKTWNFSGNGFGGYLALEADNADFTGKVNVYEKGNLLVDSNLVAQAASVQSGAGLGGVGSLSTAGGTTVKSGGSLFGGEWNKGGVLTLGGKVTLESGSALRAEVGASTDSVGYVKLAAGATLKLTAPVYVDVDTDPAISPVSGGSRKILDWSDATFDSGSAPTREDFVTRLERNPDLRRISISVRGDGLYVGYVSVRQPIATIMTLR